MKHDPPAPPELGERDGLSYALFLPPAAATGGVVILHGAGSAKESHFDFGRVCRERGLAALAFDARGHGRSSGSFGPGAVGDVLAMCDVLSAHAPHIGLRGSSMGGLLAIQAAAAEPSVAAVAAICPAPPELLARGIAAGEFDFAVDAEATLEWLGTLELSAPVAALAPRTALLLLHAEGDERVPHTVSRELYEAAGEPKRLLVFPGGHHRSLQRLLVFPGGHHRSLQHDLEVQNVTAQFLERAFGAR